MTKHILVISQYFYPESFRINDICREWVARGYKVTVLTGIPNYPEGKFYPGYSWTKRRKENWNGVQIIRIPLFPRGKRSIGLVLNYLSFPFFGFFWKLFSKVDADLVFTFEVSPMTQALIGVWYAKRKKIPHYIYVQDLWPESVISVTGIKSPLVIRPINKMVDYIYRNSEKILVTSPSFVRVVGARVEDPEKVVYWPQYAEDFYQPVARMPIPEIPDDGCFKVIFTGNIGQAQGLSILPKAAKLLKERNITSVRFVLVGDGRYKQTLLEQMEENGVSDMFVMIPRQPAERIPQLLAACDAAFLSLLEDPLLENVIPAKLQSYMACGMPIVASAKGETARILAQAECGICCAVGDSEALAEAIAQMTEANLAAFAKNARKYYADHFEKQKLMDRFEELIQEENKNECV